jgi:hypothetical protein
VLGLFLIDVSHNGQNIDADYGLTNKVFVVTLDNASSNVSAMRFLRLILSPYLGIENVDNGDEIPNLHIYVLASVLCMSCYQFDS